MNEGNLIGELTEIEVMLAARRFGINISIPFGNNLRYDQIWDVNGKLYRIQVKHARVSDDKSSFYISGKSAAGGGYNDSEIDAIVTIHNNVLYFIPINEIGQSGKTLRLFHNDNTINQPQIHWAYNYVVQNKLKLV